MLQWKDICPREDGQHKLLEGPKKEKVVDKAGFFGRGMDIKELEERDELNMMKIEMHKIFKELIKNEKKIFHDRL